MDLTNKVAVVTGGATGIGREICKTLDSLGATIVINYNSSIESAQNLSKELRQEAFLVQANIANFEEAEKLINETVNKFGKIDILVNNAGVTQDNLILRMKEEDFD